MPTSAGRHLGVAEEWEEEDVDAISLKANYSVTLLFIVLAGAPATSSQINTERSSFDKSQDLVFKICCASNRARLQPMQFLSNNLRQIRRGKSFTSKGW